MSAPGALTLGTAGHIDHGKTALVRALTGADTDRLPEEKRRGISIELGFAALDLPGGRMLSVVDVPGHERFVRTMVAGASGIDLFCLAIAADDGVMPQTREHLAVLAALGVEHGVVAITKSDRADPAPASAQAAELLPRAEIVACSARTGAGIDALAAALERAAARVDARAAAGGPAVLHVDRAFTIAGAGTVATGTLWSGSVGAGDTLTLLPAGVRVRVRSVEVHDERRERAQAGQRVAVNVTGVRREAVRRGHVLCDPGAGIEPAWILDAALGLPERCDGMRVHVHHGTRESPARIVSLGAGFWQVRADQPLLARAGDALVVRSIAPPDTLGGGRVVDPRARRHGPSPAIADRLARRLAGEPVTEAAATGSGRRPEAAEAPSAGDRRAAAAGGHPAAAPALGESALALAARLLAAGHEPPADEQLAADTADFEALRAAGRIVRLGRGMHLHADALAQVAERVAALIAVRGPVSLGELRDELNTSRKYAQALLEALDAARITLRGPDDRRVLRRGAESRLGSPAGAGDPAPGQP